MLAIKIVAGNDNLLILSIYKKSPLFASFLAFRIYQNCQSPYPDYLLLPSLHKIDRLRSKV